MIIGADCKLYRNTGTYETPVWDLIDIVENVSLNIEVGEADGSNRSSDWKITKPALKDGSVEFNLINESGHADFEAIRDAVLNKTLLDLAVMDGAITADGSQGLRAEMHLFGFSRDEQLEQVVKIATKAKPGSITNAPSWMVVSA